MKNSYLNGSLFIITNKGLDIQSVNFESDNSILVLKNKANNKTYETKLTGSVSWEKQNNLFKFNKILLDDNIVANGVFDFISQKGSANFLIKSFF